MGKQVHCVQYFIPPNRVSLLENVHVQNFHPTLVRYRQSQPRSRKGGLTCFSCELILILNELYSGDKILAKPASSPPYEQPLI